MTKKTGRTTKYAVLIGDGIADYEIEELGGRTPLEVARTPNMDAIARQGIGGLVQTIPEGRHPGSDVANLEILGYDARVHYTGRAPLEAASMGVPLEDDEVAFRCNLITTDGERIVDYSAGHISTEEGAALIRWIQRALGNEQIRFYPGVSYRHLMVMKGGPEEIRTTPPHDIMGERMVDQLPVGEQAQVVRDLMGRSAEVLVEAEVNQRRIAEGKRPATQIWLWGSGKALRLPSLRQRWGMEGGVISAVDLVKGIGICAGLRVIEVPGITGYLDTNYAGKAAYAVEALKELDFVYVHVEAPDEASHNGDVEAKIQAIEDFDALVVGPVLEGLRSFGDFRLMVLPDHRTPLSVRTHTREPVPVAIFGTHGGMGLMSGFSEREAKKGMLQIQVGHRLIEHLFQ